MNLNRLFILFILISFACEPDDICLDSYEDTPKMIIRFYDQDNKQPKNVKNLQISSDNSQETLFFSETDSISIPLDHTTDTSKFIFTINSSNSDSNSDNIFIKYNRNPIYISVGCGFIMNFDLNDIIIESDQNNWIKSFKINNQNINSETAKHIEIHH